ncbi:MAG: TonB family protein [Acidobacteriia bacterium]|nr:TonB family protein [Terriglobia bacterium]
MTLTIKDSLEAAGTSKSGSPGQNSANPQGQSTRSNPVCLEVPVIVRSLPGESGGAPGNAGPSRQEGRSVIVFDNGGVLRLPNPLPVGQKVILTNQQGRDVVGRVVGGRNLPSIKGYIEVEFIEPVSDFWQIHNTPEANRIPPAAPLDLADAAPILPSPIEQRVAPPSPARPNVMPMEQNDPGSGAPTFEDVAGLVSMSPESGPLGKKNEPALRPANAQARDASAPISVESPKIISTNKPAVPFSELAVEKLADSTAQAAFPAPGRKQPFSNESTGKGMTFSGMSSLPSPDESRGRMPLLLGGAALVLAALGGGYFFMHRGASPSAAAPAEVAVTQTSAPPATNTSSGPASAPVAEPALEQVPSQSTQPVPAVVSVPAEAAAPAPSGSQNVRLRVNPADSKTQPDRAAPRRPQVPNLKMSSPTNPGKHLASVPDGSSAASVDMAMTAAPAVASPATFGARTDRQPAPPPGPPAEISTPHAAKVVQEAKLISSTRPVYPTLAKESNTQGRVTIDVSIDEKGNVVAAKAVSGPIPLRQAAVDAVKRWKYSPAQIDGKPSPSEISIGVDFRLN